MAATSFLAAALRRYISKSPSFTTRAPSPVFFPLVGSLRAHSSASSGNDDPQDTLRDRIFRLRLPKRSATAVLEKWVSEKGNVTASELREIARDLRRAQRYKHALEVCFLYISLDFCVSLIFTKNPRYRHALEVYFLSSIVFYVSPPFTITHHQTEHLS